MDDTYQANPDTAMSTGKKVMVYGSITLISIFVLVTAICAFIYGGKPHKAALFIVGIGLAGLLLVTIFLARWVSKEDDQTKWKYMLSIQTLFILMICIATLMMLQWTNESCPSCPTCPAPVTCECQRCWMELDPHNFNGPLYKGAAIRAPDCFLMDLWKNSTLASTFVQPHAPVSASATPTPLSPSISTSTSVSPSPTAKPNLMKMKHKVPANI
eukprot:TRINITY_DN1350_c0_g4_i1.p1 TRINITY_DN1350_c0_g4~~TRINITY_DN1350_c0_g4_i1.p1  ORF type:complete len:234 (-),score=52.80 TRINITY_DN1350_c0_g4_i1:489-1130(-)